MFPLVVRARASCLRVRALCLTCLTHGLQLASILCLAWGNKAYQGALLGAGACATMPLASISLEHTDFLHQRRRGMGAALLRAGLILTGAPWRSGFLGSAAAGAGAAAISFFSQFAVAAPCCGHCTAGPALRLEAPRDQDDAVRGGGHEARRAPPVRGQGERLSQASALIRAPLRALSVSYSLTEKYSLAG